MRIDRLDITAYGCLLDRNIPILSKGLVLIYGRNEDGKSTIFSLLTTLLYGFDSPSSFPYRSWHQNRHPEFSAELALSDGSQAEVWRKLSSSPQGRLTRNGHTEKLANSSLPFVQHVGRDLYEALYALTQENIRLLDEERRREIGDRLLSGLGAKLLRPTQEVVAEIEQHAQKLWRDDNRGKPWHSELREKLRSAKCIRSEALAQDSSLRGRVERLHAVQAQVEGLEQELARLSVQLHEADVLLPVKRQLDRIEAWQSEISDLDALAALPDGLEGEHDRLCERVVIQVSAVEQLKAERQEQLLIQAQYTHEESNILEYERKIDHWVRHISAHEQEQRNIARLESEIVALQTSLESSAQQILIEPWQKRYSSEIIKIPFPELKAQIDNFEEIRRDVKRQEIAIEAVAPVRKAVELPSRLVLGTIAAGLVLCVVAFFASLPVGAVFGGTLTLLGGAGLLFNVLIRRQTLQQNSQRGVETERLRKALQRAAESQDEVSGRIREILRCLPIAEAFLARPNTALCQLIGDLRRLDDEKQRKNQQLESQKNQWDAAQDGLQNLARSLSESETNAEVISRLEDRLQDARERRDDFNQASERIEEIDCAEMKEAEKELKALKDNRDELLQSVRRAVGEDLTPEQALPRAVSLQAILRKIRTVQDQLETDHPDLADLQEKVELIGSGTAHNWLLDQEQIEKCRIRQDVLHSSSGELVLLREERTELQAEIKMSRSDISVGELDGEIESIEEDMEGVCRRRDRLMLLSSILREADRRFREKHQPDVLKRASEYLRMITGGRYTSIIALEDGDREQLAVLSEAGDDFPLARPLSRGTLDQIHLAFRLAVVDHLDEGHELLPLMLDEVLVNWDGHRIETGLRILSDLADKRQVFLFTCHEWIAERVQAVTGASRIDLDVAT